MLRERGGVAVVGGGGEGGGCGVEVADVDGDYGMENLLAGMRAAVKSREGMKAGAGGRDSFIHVGRCGVMGECFTGSDRVGGHTFFGEA